MTSTRRGGAFPTWVSLLILWSSLPVPARPAEAAMTPNRLGGALFQQRIAEWQVIDATTRQPVVRIPISVVGPGTPMALGLPITGGVPFALGGLDALDFAKIEALVQAPAPSSQRLGPTADAYVWDGANATKNFGALPTLTVKRYSGSGYTRITYLKFDLRGLTGSLVSAKLKLYCKTLQGGLPVPVTAFSVTNDGWTEAGVTWNTRPAPVAALAGATISSAGPTPLVDVTPFVVSQPAGDGILTLALQDTTAANRYVDFDSREAANRPALEVVLR